MDDVSFLLFLVFQCVQCLILITPGTSTRYWYWYWYLEEEEEEEVICLLILHFLLVLFSQSVDQPVT